MRKFNQIAGSLCLLGTLGLSSLAMAASSGNLIINGDASQGRCSTDWKAVTTVPGWQILYGAPTQVCQSISSFSVPAGQTLGNAFLADGPYGDSAMQQKIDVTSAAASIDGGGVTFDLSGLLGGYGTYNGQAIVSASFLDAGGNVLGSPARLNGVTATARGLASGFLEKEATGAVPAGTRSILVRVEFVNTSASYNIGYADRLSLTLSTPVAAPALVAPVASVPAFDHVFFVMMENTDYTEVIGDRTDAPFINSLADRGALFTNYNGVYHPSDENYLAVAGGDVFVSGAIYFPNIKVNAPHIGDSIEAAGKTWKAYEQGMGTPCNTSNNNDKYYEPDDAPFINFTSISGNGSRCAAHLFDTNQLTTDLQSVATTPNLAWLAADDYYDGEASGNGSATSLQTQDGWLKQTLTPILNSPAWTQQRSLLILTWDESETSSNNHIGGIVVGSQGLVPAGIVSTASVNHYSTGRTIEAALGLPTLTPNDSYALPLNDAFSAVLAKPVSSLQALTPSVTPGENILISYKTQAASVNAKNWVGVYKQGGTPGNGSSLVWQYAPTAGGVVALSSSGLAAGNYVAWLCYDDGYTTLGQPVSFSISN